jgi:hypothetical protein
MMKHLLVVLLVAVLSSFLQAQELPEFDQYFISPEMVELMVEVDTLKALIMSESVGDMALTFSDGVEEGHKLESFDIFTSDIIILERVCSTEKTKVLLSKLREADQKAFKLVSEKLLIPFLSLQDMTTFEHEEEIPTQVWFLVAEFTYRLSQDRPELFE